MSFTPTMAAVRNWYDLPFLDLGAVTVPTHSIHALLLIESRYAGY